MAAENPAQRGTEAQTFRIGAPPRDRVTTPVLPKRPEGVSSDSPEPKKRPTTSRRAIIARLAGTLLAVATVGPAIDHHINYESELNLPAVGRDVASIPGFYLNLGNSAIDGIQGLFNRETPVPIPPDVFDNNALGGTISSENTVALSQEEIKRTLPPIIIDSVNNTSTILFPFQLPEGTKAQFTKITVIPKDHPGSFSNQAEKVDISTILLPLGTKIVNPIEGAHVFLQKGDPKLREDPNLVKRAIFYWYDKIHDEVYVFTITPATLPGPMFKPLIQGDKYYNWSYNWEMFPVADRGLEIMETTQDFQPVVVDVTIGNGKMNSFEAAMKLIEERTSRRGQIDFFVQNAITNEKAKLVVLGN